MNEKIAFASWNYIKLVCAVHKEDLILDEVHGRPVYRCCADGCNLQLSSKLYEKILEDVVSSQNKGTLPVGACWKRKSETRRFSFTLTACANGKQPEISVTVL